ncbi:MAG: methyltransferase domain-containing protein [Streptosporangiaceae bacterium]
MTVPRHRRLGEQLIETGILPADWLTAFAAAPRHLFLPDAIWEETDRGLAPICRINDPAAWLDRAYADEPVISQVDDGGTAPGHPGHYVTSSSSAPSVMFRMLRELDVRDGMRVLEIGTGSGWNAVLLAHRLGGSNVTTVEVDPAVAARASAALAGAGVAPTVATGDGTQGHEPRAPYDRVLATASVQRVPYAWVSQTRPDGRIVTPWGTAYHNGVMLALTVAEDGSAVGRFNGQLAFMWLRSQRVPNVAVEDLVHHGDPATDSVAGLHPYEPVSDYDASFAIGLRVPDCQNLVVHDDDGDPQHYVLWLMDPASGSWAALTHRPGATSYPVRQHGPRQLWDEVEAAHGWWVDAGRPELHRFGATVSPAGQAVWMDEPSNVVNSTPTSAQRA